MVLGRSTGRVRRIKPWPNKRHLRRERRRHGSPQPDDRRSGRQCPAVVGAPDRAHRVRDRLFRHVSSRERSILVGAAGRNRAGRPCPIHRRRTIYWSVGDRYIAFDGRFEARTLALGRQTARLIALGQSGPWAPKVLRLSLSVEVGNNQHLVTASPSGKERRRLTSGREGVRPLAWSPDGKTILFEASRGAKPGFGLYVVYVRDARVVKLAAAARQGDFSPSGRRVVYSRDTGGLFTVALDGSGRRRLTGDGVMPRWSPDGQWIAFQAGARIDLIRPDGSDRHGLVGS